MRYIISDADLREDPPESEKLNLLGFELLLHDILETTSSRFPLRQYQAAFPGCITLLFSYIVLDAAHSM